MIPPARLFFITRFAWSWRYRWTGASFLFHFLSQRLPGRTSHLSLRLSSQDWRTAGAHGRIRTGLCSYIRISATHRFSSTATAYLAGLHNDTALSIYWVCMALAWLHLTDDTFYKGGFVAWRSIVWDILSLPLGHAWVFSGSFRTARVAYFAALALSTAFSVFTGISASICVLSHRSTLLMAMASFASTPASLRGLFSL
jgi:hypothetical protein